MANEAYHAKKSPRHCTNGGRSQLQLCRRRQIESGVVGRTRRLFSVSLRDLFDEKLPAWVWRKCEDLHVLASPYT